MLKILHICLSFVALVAFSSASFAMEGDEKGNFIQTQKNSTTYPDPFPSCIQTYKPPETPPEDASKGDKDCKVPIGCIK